MLLSTAVVEKNIELCFFLLLLLLPTLHVIIVLIYHNIRVCSPLCLVLARIPSTCDSPFTH